MGESQTSRAQQAAPPETTADASDSPTNAGDEETTRGVHSAPEPFPATEKVIPQMPAHVMILRDDTSEGGPLVIVTDDPELSPPRVPVDPFPTLGTPEIDPPVTHPPAGA